MRLSFPLNGNEENPVSVYGSGIGQQMLQEGKRNVLVKKIDHLSYPCQQTMNLIRLAKTMVTFQPSSRPDMNSVFRTVTGILRQGIHIEYNNHTI